MLHLHASKQECHEACLYSSHGFLEESQEVIVIPFCEPCQQIFSSAPH